MSSDPAHALLPHPPGCAGGRLLRHLGMSEEEYLRRFVRRNLMPHDYDVEHWRVRDARAAADELLAEHPPGHALVLLGGKVSAAFGVSYRENLCEPRVMVVGNHPGARRSRRVLVLPHPSGRCHRWNSKLTALRARAGLERLVES